MRIHDIRIPVGKILTVGILPSPLKKLYYRLRGYRIGRKVRFGPGSVIDISGRCEIGDGASFGAFSIITGETLRVGKRTQIRSMTIFLVPHIRIGNDVVVSETAIIRAQQPFPDSRLEIGDRAHIFPFSIIDPTRPLKIGAETAVGFGSYVFTHGAYKDKLAGYPVTYGEVTLGKGVWLPCRVFIMPGVTLGDDVVVGTGSVVTRSFPDGSFVLGEPAKLLKTREEFVTPVSREEQFEILKGILQEFKVYAEHFGGVKGELTGDTVLRLREKREDVEIVLCDTLPADAASATAVANSAGATSRIFLIHGKIEPAARDELDRQGMPWFSYDGKCCSAALTETAEVLREYLTRYGIMLERP